MARARSETVTAACRGLGPAFALLLFLFWGAFFLEHLSERSLNTRGALPPPRVWASQALDLGMLAGLALMLQWDRLGAVVTMLGTATFCAGIGMRAFPWAALPYLLPIACCAVSWSPGVKPEQTH